MTSKSRDAVGAARRDALPPNSALNDYEVERVLGSGGFGIVYLARHVDLDRPVAIKEYLPTECAVRESLTVHAKGDEYLAAFEEGLTRFRDEARRLVELDYHPAIVSCEDFFWANGTAYLVMEYVDGQPLSEVLRTREADGRPFGQSDLLSVIIPLLEGLARVHTAGVIHRDIKPSNIMIRSMDSQPVLLDFGAAKQGVAELTKSMAPCTEGYAAFEQVGDGRLGPWTDIYAVGAVMWRMVAGGNPPWEPPNPIKVESRARAKLGGADDPLPPASVLGEGRFSRRVLMAIEKCLQLQERDRFQECGELLGDLRRNPITAGNSIGAESTASPKSIPPSVNSRSRTLADEIRDILSDIVSYLFEFGKRTLVIIVVAVVALLGVLLSVDGPLPGIVGFAISLLSAGLILVFMVASNACESLDLGLSPATIKVGWSLRNFENGFTEKDASTLYDLGFMYANGRGVPQDDVRAYAWWTVASKQGSRDATADRRIVARRMTSEKIREAEYLSHKLLHL